MSIIVIDPPEDLVVSLEEAKVHLRVDHDDDDDYIEALIAAATATIDGPDGWLGRALVEQTLEWQGNQFCGDVTLGYPPLINIVSVKYIDTDGVEQIVPSDQYRLVGSTSRPRLALAYGAAWPAVRSEDEAVKVRYSAGWPVETEGEGDDAVTTWTGPAPIRHAVLMMVSELYENREASSDVKRAELPFAVEALLSTYRILSI